MVGMTACDKKVTRPRQVFIEQSLGPNANLSGWAMQPYLLLKNSIPILHSKATSLQFCMSDKLQLANAIMKILPTVMATVHIFIKQETYGKNNIIIMALSITH